MLTSPSQNYKGDQKGFVPIVVLSIIVVIIMVGIASWRAVLRYNTPDKNSGENTSSKFSFGSLLNQPLNNTEPTPTPTSPSGTTPTPTVTKTLSGSPTLAPTASTSTPTPQTVVATSTPTPAPTSSVPTSADVSYTDGGYSPGTVTIKVGGTVTFKNNSSKNMWPASDSHPTHTDYPGFDSLQGIAAGGQWSFTFTKTGTWGYHDHLTPGKTGTIVVQ